MAVVEIELADLWDRVIEHVSLGEPQHRAFLTMTKPLGLIQSDGGITNLLVAAPNVFAKDVLESRLRVVVNEVLTRELGFTMAGSNGGAYALNGSVSMTMADAQIEGSEITLESLVAMRVATKSVGSQKAFKAGAGLVIQNNLASHAILREIDVAHPAAKNMLELARGQDEEVGDGTTSVIILAGELLVVAEPFLVRGMHPTVIVNAFHRALEASLEIAEKLAKAIDVTNRTEMRELVRSCIGTKFSSRYGDLICDLALDAVARVANSATESPLFRSSIIAPAACFASSMRGSPPLR